MLTIKHNPVGVLDEITLTVVDGNPQTANFLNKEQIATVDNKAYAGVQEATV